MLKPILIAAVMMFSAGAAWSEEDALIAILREDSGSLPPEYAWSYRVRFFASGQVEAEYCKGYAEEAPGCATLRRKLPSDASAAMSEELLTATAGLAADPPRQLSGDQIPLGGGSVGGWVLVDGEGVDLTEFPVPEDAPKVAAVLAILQKHTPSNIVKKAQRRAKQP
jgi:hypothetical protein